MGTDRYAYQSKLRRVDPVVKLAVSLVCLVVCLACDSMVVGLATLVMMAGFTVVLGGQTPSTVWRFLTVPLVFLLIGCITIVVRPVGGETEVLASVTLLGRWPWGVTATYLTMGLSVFCKAMGTVSAMCFLTLTTPVCDVVLALERLRVPKLMVELMELMYRFVFVLLDCAQNIRVAQDARLGYVNGKTALKSMGTLGSMVFVRGWRRSDKVWSALESRGYTGTLNTVGMGYEKAPWLYGVGVAVVAVQLGILWFERGWL